MCLLLASREVSEASKQHLLAALIQLVQEGRDVDKAVASLARIGARGDARVIHAVLLGLAFGSRMQVRNALRRLADKGDPIVVEAVSRYFAHDDGSVRREAILATPHLVRRGDKTVVTKLIGALTDHELRVRMAATDALRHVASWM
eukprot:g29144.t1